MATPPKQVKLAYSTTFSNDYTLLWPCIKPSTQGSTYAECTYCSTSFSIAHGGRNDVKKHLATTKHVRLAELSKSAKPVTEFFKPKSDEHQETAAAAAFTCFLIEHNVPLAAAEHSKQLLQKMCPDSKIAKAFTCGRTKTSALVESMADNVTKSLVQRMKSSSFSIATDGSNDRGSVQLYPVVVRSFDPDVGKVTTELLSVEACDKSSTGENIFALLDNAFERHGISWNNCLCFSSDNAAVMTGCKKGVAAFIHEKNSNIFFQGCPCHLLHIAAKNATKELPIDVEEILTDIYFYLDKSSKRCQELARVQEECGAKIRKIIKHGATRWLSLERCIVCLLEQWDALKKFFTEESTSQKTKNQRLERIVAFLGQCVNKLYCLFLKFALPIFTKANLALQQDAPLIHCMRRRLQDVLTDLFSCFLKPEVVAKAKTVLNVDFQKKTNTREPSSTITVGTETKAFLAESTVKKELSVDDTRKFYSAVRHFFREACDYVANKFPLDNELLKQAEIIDITCRLEMSSQNLEFFFKKFPHLVPETDRDTLVSEFCKFQMDSAIVQSDERIDVQWVNIGTRKDSSGNPKYACLVQFMLQLLTIPHSNSDSERVFSLVRKNKTDFRANLSPTMLSSLLVQKVHMLAKDKHCYNMKFTKDELCRLKSATVVALQSSKRS